MKNRKIPCSNSLFANALLSFVKTACNVLFPIITFSYASRILGVEGIGRVNFTKSFTMYFTMIAMLGMNYYGTREAAKIRERKNDLCKFVYEMLVINAISTTCAYFLLFFAMVFVHELHSYIPLLLINSISILFAGMGLEWLYQALEEYRYIAIRSVVIQIVALLLMVIFVKDKEDVAVYAVICVIASYGSYLFNFIHSRKFINLGPRPQIIEIKKHIRPILLLFSMTLSIELYTVLDSTMLGLIKDDNAVGLYSSAIKINKIVNTLITSIGVVLLPRLSYYIGLKELKKLEEVSILVYQLIFMLSTPAALGLYVLSDEIILLFSGVAFQEAVVTMKILIPIVIVIPFSVITNLQLFVPMKKEKLIIKSTCAGAITNFIFNCLLIPLFSENGAAIATVLAETVVSIICLINLKKFFDLKKIFYEYYQFWCAVIPIYIIGYLFKVVISNYIIRIIGVMFVSTIVYFGLLWIMKNTCIINFTKMLNQKFLRNIEIRKTNNKL